MIVPLALAGAAFSEAADGDIRNDPGARDSVSVALGVSSEWATLRQVHGARVRRAEVPGDQGEADALWSTVPELPLAVYTADCVGVVLHGDASVGVAHAGWRGAVSGVVGALVAEMTASGHPPGRAVVGPAIGPCCFEVGEEVAALFPDHTAETTWGTGSVDLVSAISGQLEGLSVEVLGGCTRHETRYFSHRRDATPARQAALGWLP